MIPNQISTGQLQQFLKSSQVRLPQFSTLDILDALLFAYLGGDYDLCQKIVEEISKALLF